MTTPEIDAAKRHLNEVRGLGEAKRVIEQAEQRLRDAEAKQKPPEVKHTASPKGKPKFGKSAKK